MICLLMTESKLSLYRCYVSTITIVVVDSISWYPQLLSSRKEKKAILFLVRNTVLLIEGRDFATRAVYYIQNSLSR